MRVALLIALYAVLAAIAVVFLGVSVPFCSGGIDGRMSQECIDHWLANQSLVERFFGTPWPAVVAFVIASAVTIWWSRRHSRRRSRGQDPTGGPRRGRSRTV